MSNASSGSVASEVKTVHSASLFTSHDVFQHKYANSELEKDLRF